MSDSFEDCTFRHEQRAKTLERLTCLMFKLKQLPFVLPMFLMPQSMAKNLIWRIHFSKYPKTLSICPSFSKVFQAYCKI